MKVTNSQKCLLGYSLLPVHAQSSEKQSVLPVTKEHLYITRFISPNMLTLESPSHTSPFPMLLSLLVFLKEWLHLVLGLILNATLGLM